MRILLFLFFILIAVGFKIFVFLRFFYFFIVLDFRRNLLLSFVDRFCFWDGLLSFGLFLSLLVFFNILTLTLFLIALWWIFFINLLSFLSFYDLLCIIPVDLVLFLLIVNFLSFIWDLAIILIDFFTVSNLYKLVTIDLKLLFSLLSLVFHILSPSIILLLFSHKFPYPFKVLISKNPVHLNRYAALILTKQISALDSRTDYLFHHVQRLTAEFTSELFLK